MFGLKSWKIFVLLVTSLKCFKTKKKETFIKSQVAFFKTSENVDSGVSSREWKGLGTCLCVLGRKWIFGRETYMLPASAQ